MFVEILLELFIGIVDVELLKPVNLSIQMSKRVTVESPVTTTSVQRPLFWSWQTVHAFTLILTSLQRSALHNKTNSIFIIKGHEN